jgi:ferrochelatase
MHISNPLVYSHSQVAKIAVILGNLGTPDAPTAGAVRRYLAQFLGDARVVEIPKPLWWLILHGIILRVRPAKSAKKYASIWTDQGSPLMVGSLAQREGLAQALQARGHQVSVHLAMTYGQPALPELLDRLQAQGVTRILVLPAYPQYSATTTAALFDQCYRWSLKARRLPEWRFINHFHDQPAYIAALAQQVRQHWQTHGEPERLVMSFHGVPERTLHLGDPYHCECQKTGRLLAQALGLSKDRYLVTFQSRFGKAKWLEPYTEPSLVALAQSGVRRVDVICPGFLTDCLETLEEIQQEAREAFLHAGGQTLGYIPCLNDAPAGIQALADLAEQHLQGWPTRTAESPADVQARVVAAQALGAKA